MSSGISHVPGQLRRAVLLMTASTVLFGLMAVCIRLASKQLHPFEIAFFRNLFGFVFTLPLLFRHGPGMLRTNKLPLYFFRCCIGIVSMLSGFWAIAHLPLAQAEALREAHPGLPVFGNDAAARKLSAAWLIEQCGWKGFREGDAGISAQHSLVLVNHGRATGPQLLELARRVAGSVQEKFGVALEPEPRIIGARWAV